MIEDHDPEKVSGGAGRVLLLGEDNPYGSEPEFALYCYPPGCAGYRLRRILGLSEDQYLGLHRANLCDSQAWSLPEARRQARLLVSDPSAPWRVIVMLGRKVANAFSFEQPFFTHNVVPRTDGEMHLVSLPHSSGRNTLWNNQSLVVLARKLLREWAPEVPWGSADEGVAQGVAQGVEA